MTDLSCTAVSAFMVIRTEQSYPDLSVCKVAHEHGEVKQ